MKTKKLAELRRRRAMKSKKKKYKPPTKKHFALNTTTRMYNRLLFGLTAKDIGIDINTHCEKVPRGGVDSGKFNLGADGIRIDGVLIIKYDGEGE